MNKRNSTVRDKLKWPPRRTNTPVETYFENILGNLSNLTDEPIAKM